MSVWMLALALLDLIASKDFISLVRHIDADTVVNSINCWMVIIICLIFVVVSHQPWRCWYYIVNVVGLLV